VQDDIDPDLLPIFLEEAQEIVPQVGDALRRWRAAPVNHAPVTELARHLHTLKGSARMAGLMRLGELAHVMETDIIEMERESVPPTAKFDKIDEGLDRFNAALDRIAKGDLVAPIEIPVAVHVSEQLPAPMAKLAAARAEIVAEGEKLEGRERQALLRVNADMIDRFVNEAGELAIARSRIDLEMIAFKRALIELSENVGRMKVQLREIEIQAETQIQSRTKEAQEHGGEFDPLEFDRFSRMQEITRFLAESLNDVVTLQQSLNSNIDETEAALLQQGRLNRDLQQGLMGVRLVPLGNLQDRFYRLVRQTAKELDKKANLEFRGVRVEIDRSVLEKITGPFEHLLRNAVSHGLEMPHERAAKGKSEIGEITIDARQAGNEIMLTLSDDGGGLNFERIREKAIQQGLLAANDEVSDAQLTQYIFMAGFSTASEVTQISGRGVGMDVVRSEIVSLGGRIDISSTPGRGTSFTIALPLTLAVTQAVMVVVNDTTYAIPSVMIEQVQEYKGKRYEPLLELNEIDWKGNKYPLRSMEAMLGGKPTISAQRKASVILAKSGQQRAAVQVDEIIGNREIVVKNIGPQLARLVGVAGATVMGSGQVILILNPVQLVFREAATVKVEKVVRGTEAAEKSASSMAGVSVTSDTAPVVEAELMKGVSLAETIAANMFDEGGFVKEDVPTLARTIPLVMVVDDSLTVRKITSRMLIREGFEVATAKDGVDGLQQLQDIQPDIILLDIEMPRMDGFEFARNVRADAKARDIPIIMITSRTADKHRNRAMELGVNEYMGKPYQEEQLLAMIRSFTKHITAGKLN
jgi:chemosensory pili system protein ChpA (sensor histidine kinase/response regulator)